MMTQADLLAHQQLAAQGYPSQMMPHPQAHSYAQAVQAHAQMQAQAQIQAAAMSAAAQQAQGMHQAQQANGLFRSETPNGRAMSQQAQHLLAQQIGPDNAGSPSTDSGMSAKRGADPSPVDAQASKRARMGTKRPSESFDASPKGNIDVAAPEEHQRQAIEVANRAAAQHMPAPNMPNFAGQPIQRQVSQVSLHPLLDCTKTDI